LKTAIAVFVKTPGLTPLKTRLAAGIGQDKANAFYALSVKCIQSELRNVTEGDDSFHVYWAIAEAEGLTHPWWKGFLTISQGNGDLGERLHKVYDKLMQNHDAVLLMGADSPQLSQDVFWESINRLKEDSSYVIGPALDGGFYLFGGKKELPKSFWTSIPYSVENTLSILKRELIAHGKWTELQSMYDVDQSCDLWAILSELEKSNRGEKQQLAAWVKGLQNHLKEELLCD